MKKIVVYAPDETANRLDRASVEARAKGGEYVSRSELVVAIIESVDVERFAVKLAKVAK
jgi:hypothetical protein